MRDLDHFRDEHRYRHAMSVIQRAEELVSAPCYPSRFYAPGIYASRFDAFSTGGVIAAAHDTKENIFLEYFSRDAARRVADCAPRLIVVSANHSGQLIPAITLARVLRDRLPSAHLHLYGNYTYFYTDLFDSWPAFFDVFHSVAPFDYEYGSAATCAGLVDALEGERSFSGVPGILFRSAAGGITATERLAVLDDPEGLADADFEGLPLGAYLSPKLVLPLALTIGCHWGRCSFCARRRAYRYGSPEKLVHKMMDLATRYGCQDFYLTDDCIPPDLMKRFCECLVNAGLDSRWYVMVRPEPQFDRPLAQLMYRAGCRHVFLGVESGSQPVLNRMRKGTTVEKIRSTVRDLSEAGISILLSAMIGFPGETEEDARKTLEMLVESRPWVTNVVCERYLLQSGTPVYEDPARYGISRIDRRSDEAGYDLRFTTNTGMTRDRVGQLNREFQAVLNREYPKPNLQTLLLDYSHCSHTLLRAGRSVSNGEPAAPGAAPDSSCRPRFDPEQVGIRALRFPFQRVFETAESLKAFSLNQGHQHWSQAAEAGAGHRTLPSPSCCVYSGQADAFMELSPAAVRLLKRCDGSRPVTSLVQAFPAERRGAAETLLGRMLAKGILKREATSDT